PSTLVNAKTTEHCPVKLETKRKWLKGCPQSLQDTGWPRTLSGLEAYANLHSRKAFGAEDHRLVKLAVLGRSPTPQGLRPGQVIRLYQTLTRARQSAATAA
ncbi:MAG TPA: hypothetical protein VHS80_00885, partial [Chthoniobacterales bacterium]|nr:hypothetical protein [Chthoniobacterales bacterium]